MVSHTLISIHNVQFMNRLMLAIRQSLSNQTFDIERKGGRYFKSFSPLYSLAFCLSKCPYCDFNSHVRGQIDEQAWKEGLIHELKRYANLLQSWKQSYQLKYFFGGGTPSLMKPQTVECLIQEAKILWSTDKDLEITLKANPNSVEVESFQGLTQAGVNRLSIGIQAFK